MAVETPLIDKRTYADLVAQIEALAAQFSAGEVAPVSPATSPAADALAGMVLDQNLPNPQGGAPLCPGTWVDDALAKSLAALPNLGIVQIRGWQARPAVLSVPATVDLLTGAVLGQDLAFPAAHPPLAVAKGTLVDDALAQQVAAAAGAGTGARVKIALPADLGSALVRVFGRMAELAVDRLNRLPDRNFLAFLDLIGTRLAPPQPARVPITFELVAGSAVDTLVPAGSQVVATPLPGEKDPVLFETERDLVVTRSQLAAVFTREPGRDLYEDVTAVAIGPSDGAFNPFLGTRPIGHRFYIGHSSLAAPEVKDSVVLRVTPADVTRPWANSVVWEAWDGTHWCHPTSAVAFESGNPSAWRVTLSNLTALPPLSVGGVTSSWLRGRLTAALPAGELALDPAGSGDLQLQRLGPPTAGFACNPTTTTYEPIDFAAPFYPFGATWQLPIFYLAVGRPLDKPDSQVQIEIDVAVDQGPGGGTTLFEAQVAFGTPTTYNEQLKPSFTWEYWTGSGAWVPLPGVSFQAGRGARSGGVFLSSGTLRFAQPADWASSLVNGVAGFWVRARVTLTYVLSLLGTPAIQPPRVTRVVGGFSWLLPRVDLATLALTLTRGSLLPALGFSNQVPVDLTKDFFPFGEKPRIGDTFYLSNEEAFAKPGAQVTLTVR